MSYMYVTSQSPEYPLGHLQSELFGTHNDLVAKQVSLDVQSKKDTLDAVYHVAKNAGFFQQGGCGTYYGIPLWTYKNPEDEYAWCAPNVTQEITNTLSSTYPEHAVYTEARPHVVVAGQGLLPETTTLENGRNMTDRLSFTHDFPYTLKAYENITHFIKELNEACSDKEDEDLATCVHVQAQKNGFEDDTKEEFSPSPNEHMKEQLKEMQRTNYRICHEEYEHIEETFTFKQNGRNTLFDNEVFSFPLSVFTSDSEPVVADELVYDGDEEEIQGIALDEFDVFTDLPFTWQILSKQAKSERKDFFEDRPCSQEKRTFRFRFSEEAFYPLREDIVYEFAVYVKDEVPPAFSDLRVFDKNFDQENVFVSWKHTYSKDLKAYTIFVDDSFRKQVIPWEVIIREAWDEDEGKTQGLFEQCKLEKEEGTVQCLFDTGEKEVLKDEAVYYFTEQRQFLFITEGGDGETEVIIEAVDDDTNTHNETESGERIDDLPYEPVSVEFFAAPECAVSWVDGVPSYTFLNIIGGTSPSHTMDGEDESAPNTYIILENPPRRGKATSSYVISDLSVPITLGGARLCNAGFEYLVVAVDPSLDVIEIDLNEMGFEPKKITYSVPSSQ